MLSCGATTGNTKARHWGGQGYSLSSCWRISRISPIASRPASFSRSMIARLLRITSLNCLRAFTTSALRSPCTKAFWLLAALPASVRGPVLFSHGFHCLMRSACLARRSGVQPFPMLMLQ